jgi:hypothetical protein
MTEPPSQTVEELVKLYPNYSFRYTSAQAKTKHAVRNKIGTSEIASDYASAPCGRSPVWFSPVGWMGTGNQEEYERNDALPSVQAMSVHADSGVNDASSQGRLHQEVRKAPGLGTRGLSFFLVRHGHLGGRRVAGWGVLATYACICLVSSDSRQNLYRAPGWLRSRAPSQGQGVSVGCITWRHRPMLSSWPAKG